MYVDSEAEGPTNYGGIDSSAKKGVLQAKFYSDEEDDDEYGEDDENIEKIVVCSVINSERPVGDESLSNTQ
jgi:hypothetical protein